MVHVAVIQTAQKPLDVGDNDDDDGDIFTQGFQPVPNCHINSQYTVTILMVVVMMMPSPDWTNGYVDYGGDDVASTLDCWMILFLVVMMLSPHWTTG